MTSELYIYTSPFTHALEGPFWDLFAILAETSPQDLVAVLPSEEAKTVLQARFPLVTFKTPLEMSNSDLPVLSLFLCGLWRLSAQDYKRLDFVIRSAQSVSALIYTGSSIFYREAKQTLDWLETYPHRRVECPAQSEETAALSVFSGKNSETEVHAMAQAILESPLDVAIMLPENPRYASWIRTIFPKYGLWVTGLPFPLSDSFCVAQFLESFDEMCPDGGFSALPSEYPSLEERSAYTVLKEHLSEVIKVEDKRHFLSGIEHRVLHSGGIQILSKEEMLFCQKKILFMPGFCEEFSLEEKGVYGFFSHFYHAEKIWVSFSEDVLEGAGMMAPVIEEVSCYLGETVQVGTLPQAEGRPPLGSPLLEPGRSHLPGALADCGKIASTVVEFDRKAFSITELECYQKCPRQYFYRYVLRERVEEPVGEIGAAEWGRWVHGLLEDYFRGGNGTLKEVALRRLNQTGFDWGVKKALLFGIEGKRGLLEAILVEEETNPLPLAPIAFEYGFEDFKLVYGGEEMVLRGTIDVVLGSQERGFSGVLDYKTGAHVPSGADIRHFRSVQLPLYLLAVGHYFPSMTPAGGVYYQVKEALSVGKTIACITESAKEADFFELGRKRPALLDRDFFEAFKAHLFHLKRLIEAGHFSEESEETLPHMMSGRPQTCSLCDYRAICTYSKRFEKA